MGIAVLMDFYAGLRRDVHLDHLGDKLTEPRVAKVIEMVLARKSAIPLGSIEADDLRYVIQLGLLVNTPRGLQIANPVYDRRIKSLAHLLSE